MGGCNFLQEVKLPISTLKVDYWDYQTFDIGIQDIDVLGQLLLIYKYFLPIGCALLPANCMQI